MTAVEWLSKNLERMAELIAVNNGKMKVHGYGYITSYPEHPYGRIGLEQNEAFELMETSSYLCGLLDAREGQEFPEVRRMIEEKIQAKMKEKTNGRITDAGQAGPQS